MKYYTVDSGAYTGQTTTQIAAHLATDITAHTPVTPADVLLSMGSNNICGAQAVLETDYGAILDGINAAWASARVFVTKTWIRGYDSCADVHAAAIDAVLATRGAFAFVGPDERVTLKGADNGATNTVDGVHPSAAGSAALAAAWMTILGY